MEKVYTDHDIQALELEYVKLREALAFYANEDHYFFNSEGRGIVVPDAENRSAVSQDLGAVAKRALGDL
jgi:hypothetical protein